jgi:murein DD-endopeptidase MepM/ murein hydrolase activator NlpD
MRHLQQFTSSSRGAGLRLAVAAALALPATAIAAPATDDAHPDGSRERAETPTGVAALIAGYGVGLTSEPRNTAGPFNPVEAKVDYGTAINTFGGGGMRTHEGQDMFAPEGTPEISPMATEVLETGTDGGRGNWAALYEPRSKRTFVYMHMLEPAEVEAGQKLAAGDRVGLLGCTGSCDGAHLHFEIRAGKGPYGEPVDPLPELQRWARYTGD